MALMMCEYLQFLKLYKTKYWNYKKHRKYILKYQENKKIEAQVENISL